MKNITIIAGARCNLIKIALIIKTITVFQITNQRFTINNCYICYRNAGYGNTSYDNYEVL